MSTKKILGFSFSKETFAKSAKNIFNNQVERALNSSRTQFNNIVLQAQEREQGQKPNETQIQEVYDTFIELACENQLDALEEYFNQTRLVRTLLWCLAFPPAKSIPIIKSDLLLLVIKLSNRSEFWRDRYISIYLISMLKEWDSLRLYTTNFENLSQFLNLKLENCENKRKSIRIFSERKSYFLNSNGSEMVAQYAYQNKIDLSRISIFMGFSNVCINYPYFEEVLGYYFNEIKNNKDWNRIEQIISFLKLQKVPKSRKIILSLLIKEVNTLGIPEIKNQIKLAAFALLGDPTLKQNWSLGPDADKEDRELVLNAFQILESWVNEEFIIVFFEKLIQDKSRKKFWEKYVNNISRIQVVGNRDNYQLMRNSSVKDYVPQRFHIVNSSMPTCALVMYMKEYILVEFTDVGSLYVYHNSNSFITDLLTKDESGNLNLRFVIQLKQKNLMIASDANSNIIQQGRITHSGSWEPRVKKWLLKYPLNNQYSSKSISHKSDQSIRNDLFSAKKRETYQQPLQLKPSGKKNVSTKTIIKKKIENPKIKNPGKERMEAVLSVFFNDFSSTKNRGKFWIRQLKHIDDLFLFGNSGHLDTLMINPLIGKKIKSKFQLISHTGGKCAIMLFVKNFVLIEFSGQLPLYIYKRNGTFFRKNFLKNGNDHYIKIKELKHLQSTSSSSVIDKLNNSKPEGTITSREDLFMWFSKYVKNNE